MVEKFKCNNFTGGIKPVTASDTGHIINFRKRVGSYRQANILHFSHSMVPLLPTVSGTG